MKNLRILKTSNLQVFGIFALFLSGCNFNTASTSNTCEANTVQFMIYPGRIQSTCGCAEGSRTLTAGNSQTCTVKVGTTAVFTTLTDATSPHQLYIQSSGQVFQYHAASSATAADTYVLRSTGTFTFGDSADAVSGVFNIIP